MNSRLNRTPSQIEPEPSGDSAPPPRINADDPPTRPNPAAGISAADAEKAIAEKGGERDTRRDVEASIDADDRVHDEAARARAWENDMRSPNPASEPGPARGLWGEWEAVRANTTSSRHPTNSGRLRDMGTHGMGSNGINDPDIDDSDINSRAPQITRAPLGARERLQMRLGERVQRKTHPQAVFNWRELLRPENLLTNLMRLGFMLIVVAVLGGTWVVASAHLEEQMLGAPQTTRGLIDPTAGDGALTPDNIEHQILAFSLRLREEELTIPAGADPRPRPFTVNPGEAARFVAARLQSAGFVHDADLFNLYLRVNGLERRVEAGNFMLSETMTIPEVAVALQTALFEEVLITIPEGFRAEEIAERLAENNVIEPDRFLAAIRQPQSLSIIGDYPFLQDLPADASLEGFLFPDTYRFPVFAAQPELVIAPFLSNFNARAAGALAGGNSGFNGRDLITLASIVEREAVQADERPLIASVYVNRLAGRCVGEVGGNYLQADPTVQYARGTVGEWWWQPQDISEYSSVISPYNTYLHPGLPPGPIASPGLSAIEATSNPEPTDYCFFLGTGSEGRHVFARTLAEHEQNMRTYGY